MTAEADGEETHSVETGLTETQLFQQEDLASSPIDGEETLIFSVTHKAVCQQILSGKASVIIKKKNPHSLVLCVCVWVCFIKHT